MDIIIRCFITSIVRFALVHVIVYPVLHGVSGTIELQPVQNIPGGRIDVSHRAGIYGNNVTERVDTLNTGQRQLWLDTDISLASGPLLKFYLYTSPTEGAVPSRIRMQIWRPTDQSRYNLVWEAVSNMVSQPMGSLLVFEIPSEDSIHIQQGDHLGWVSEETSTSLSLDNVSYRKCIRMTVGENFPQVGETYQFDTLGFPYAFSFAVSIGTGDDHTPMIVGVAPLHGPLAGGTHVTIMGRAFLPVERVTLEAQRSVPLIINNRSRGDFLEVVTPPVNSAMLDIPLTLSLVFRGGQSLQSSYSFRYRANPRIMDIHPLNTIATGGTTLTVEGTAMDSVAHPVLESTLVFIGQAPNHVTRDDVYSEEVCSPRSGTQLHCPTPGLSSIAREYLTRERPEESTDGLSSGAGTVRPTGKLEAQLYIGLRLDGHNSYRNLTANPETANLGTLTIYTDPEFRDTKQVFVFKKDVSIAIKGRGLSRGTVASAYVVAVGTSWCNVTSLTDSSIHCLPPQTEPDPSEFTDSKHHEIVVNIGSHIKTKVGELQYKSTDAVLIAVPTVTVALVIAAVIAVTVVCVRKKRQKTSKDDADDSVTSSKDGFIDLPPIQMDDT